MTQTQDEQNVQVPVTPVQDSAATSQGQGQGQTQDQSQDPKVVDPVQNADETDLTNNGPDLSAVDFSTGSSTDNTEGISQEEKPTTQDQDFQTEGFQTNNESGSDSQDKSLIENGTDVISDTFNDGVETVKGVGQAGVDSIHSAATQGVESVKETVSFAGDTLKQTSESAISGVKGIGDNLKSGFSQTFQDAASGGGILESGTAVVKGTVNTAGNVVGNAATSVMNTGESVVNGTLDTATNIATGATNVVKDGFNNVVGSVLPGQAGQAVTNVTNKVTQGAQDLGVKAKETLQETGQKAKGFFSGIWDNFKSGFSSKDAQKVMDEANAPMSSIQQQNPQVQQPVAPQVQQPVAPQVQQPVASQIQQPVAPQIQQPVAPQVQQPVAPQVQQPVAPQVQQPAEVQPGDVQQPTNPTV